MRPCYLLDYEICKEPFSIPQTLPPEVAVAVAVVVVAVAVAVAVLVLVLVQGWR